MDSPVPGELHAAPPTAFGRLGARLGTSAERLLGDPVFRQKLKFFRSIFLFKEVGRRDLARIVKQMMEKSYAPGDLVFQEGDMGRAFYVVGEGRVEVTRRNQATNVSELVAQFGPGDIMGEMVLLDELPRNATARAVEPTRLYVMYKDVFDELRTGAPRAAAPILYALGRLLSARLRHEQRPIVRPSLLHNPPNPRGNP